MNLPPELFLGAVKPMFGFQGALGYEWQRFRVSVSSGYSQSAGDNPLVESIYFIPITGRLGYAFPFNKNWGLEADLGAGIQYSKTLHYETALDLYAGRRSESREIKPFAETRLHATLTILNNFLKIYAGGGVGVVFETDSPIALPMLDLGISIKPFALYSPKKREAKIPVKKLPEPVPEPAEEPAEELVEELEEDIVEDIVEDIAEEPDIIQILFQEAVYFEADSGAKILAQSLPLLREAGRQLRENPEARLILRGYAAPSGTMEGQTVVSAARVWFCTEYLKREYGIAEDRIQMRFFGAKEASVSEDAEWQLRRRVELIVESSPKAPEPSAFDPLNANTAGKTDVRSARFQYMIYFEADRGTKMLAQSLPLLREAGRRLRANPRMRIILRGYAAPSGTMEGQAAISAARVWFCAEYLKREYGIAEKRIQMQFFGAEEESVSEDAEWQLRRRVELILK